MNQLYRQQRFLSVFILLIFAISVTPKKYLHDVVSNHSDRFASTSDQRTQIRTASFNCNWENLVAESSFTGSAEQPELSAPASHLIFNCPLTSGAPGFSIFKNGDRGPPQS